MSSAVAYKTFLPEPATLTAISSTSIDFPAPGRPVMANCPHIGMPFRLFPSGVMKKWSMKVPV